MINTTLPEPRLDTRQCIRCQRFGQHTGGRLIHWPAADCKRAIVNGTQTFSFWRYVCQGCRAAEARRKRAENVWRRRNAMRKD